MSFINSSRHRPSSARPAAPVRRNLPGARLLWTLPLLLGSQACRTVNPTGRDWVKPLQSAVKMGNAYTSAYGSPLWGTASSFGGLPAGSAVYGASSLIMGATEFNEKFKRQDPALFRAVRMKERQELKRLIDRGYDPIVDSEYTETIFHLIIEVDDPEFLEFALASVEEKYGKPYLDSLFTKSFPETYGKESNHLLSFAAKRRSWKVFDSLLARDVTGGFADAHRILFEALSDYEAESFPLRVAFLERMEKIHPELLPEDFRPPQDVETVREKILRSLEKGEVKEAVSWARHFRALSPAVHWELPDGRPFPWHILDLSREEQRIKAFLGFHQLLAESLQDEGFLTLRDLNQNTLLMAATALNQTENFCTLAAALAALENQKDRETYLAARNADGQNILHLLWNSREEFEAARADVLTADGNWFDDVRLLYTRELILLGAVWED